MLDAPRLMNNQYRQNLGGGFGATLRHRPIAPDGWQCLQLEATRWCGVSLVQSRRRYGKKPHSAM
jgi:hypothetical protein